MLIILFFFLGEKGEHTRAGAQLAQAVKFSGYLDTKVELQGGQALVCIIRVWCGVVHVLNFNISR